jgi:transposase InsO family protein
MARRVLEQGWTLTSAARAAEVSVRTAAKWVARYRAEGKAGLLDRPSAAHRVANRTDEERIQAIAALRRLRMTAGEIALCLGMAPSTVSGLLGRIGLGTLSRLEPPEPANRYVRRRPGELVHIDAKKLGRIIRPGHRVTGDRRQRATGRAGWEYVHVCVDDATRLAYVEVLADERTPSAIGFLRRALVFYRRHGIRVERLLTDNGSAYRSALHGLACRALGVRHLRTRPYRPRTNGKAERFIRTLMGGWAYGAIYATSAERRAALDGWLWHYNHRRPHGSLGHQPPIARLRALNNPLGLTSRRRPLRRGPRRAASGS